jgi:GNAT superfamily N-acetyltransferase
VPLPLPDVPEGIRSAIHGVRECQARRPALDAREPVDLRELKPTPLLPSSECGATVRPMWSSSIDIKPLTPELWPQFEIVMGRWCMYWRISRADFGQRNGAKNKARFKRLVEQGPPPGLIAFVNREPAGWVQVSPRAELPTLNNSRLLKPVDDALAWSISCSLIRGRFRGQGLTEALVKAATGYAKQRGARIVEAYPWATTEKKAPVTIYTGIASTFERAGFKTVAARAPHRPIMRKDL